MLRTAALRWNGQFPLVRLSNSILALNLGFATIWDPKDLREIRKLAVLDMVHFVEYMVSRLRIHSFGRKPCYKEAYSESTNYMELDWRLARSYKGKSESFRLRFVLFTTVHSADFPLFSSGPAHSNSVLCQKWARNGGLQFFWHGAPNFSCVVEWLMLL